MKSYRNDIEMVVKLEKRQMGLPRMKTVYDLFLGTRLVTWFTPEELKELQKEIKKVLKDG